MPVDDEWSLTTSGATATATPPSWRLSIKDHPTPKAPDAFSGPAWEKPWIDPDFRDELFPEPQDRSRRTYLLLDAGLWSRTSGVFEPEEIDVPCQCLFTGHAAEDLKRVAPYLLDLTLDQEDGVAPDFHRDFFSRGWAKETGIMIQSDLDMRSLWRHFRRFTKVTTPSGAVAYFRFWDPRLLLSFLRACTSEEMDRFFPSSDSLIWLITRSELFETTKVRSAGLIPR